MHPSLNKSSSKMATAAALSILLGPALAVRQLAGLAPWKVAREQVRTLARVLIFAVTSILTSRFDS
jgi:hypothetical protein